MTRRYSANATAYLDDLRKAKTMYDTARAESDSWAKNLHEMVVIARDHFGIEWADIAEVLGISKQAAHKRFVASTKWGRR